VLWCCSVMVQRMRQANLEVTREAMLALFRGSGLREGHSDEDEWPEESEDQMTEPVEPFSPSESLTKSSSLTLGLING
jgi:hypothetical protein